MTAITITVQDNEVRAALAALSARASNMQPIMQSIGEDIVERAKQRFLTSTGPDGKRWAPNSRVTIERYIAGKGGFGKKGITDKGAGFAMSKKPLIGHSRDLSRQLFRRADNRSVTIGSTVIYAAVQQFGARMGEFGRYSQISRRQKFGEKDFRRHAGTKKGFPIPWGNIPARPFLPITGTGQLYPAEKARVLAALNAYLAGK